MWVLGSGEDVRPRCFSRIKDSVYQLGRERILRFFFDVFEGYIYLFAIFTEDVGDYLYGSCVSDYIFYIQRPRSTSVLAISI